MSALLYLAVQFYSLIFKIVVKLRGFPIILYIILISTVWADWYRSSPYGDLVGFVIVGLIALSWIITFVKFLRRSKEVQ